MSVYPQGVTVVRSASISPDGIYRYSLTRCWDMASPKFLPFIMLNPSTADADVDDPTIRRCVGLARSHGYTGVLVWNLYAYRTKSPPAMFLAARHADIVGPDTDALLEAGLLMCRDLGRPVVAAWGANARLERVEQVLKMGGSETLHYLALTNSGAPRHPLYLPSDCELRPWPPT